MKKRIIRRAFCLLLTLCVLLPVIPTAMPVPVSAAYVPTDESLWESISTICQRCLDYDRTHYGMCRGNGYTGFPSLCAHYVHIQLMLLGVNNRYIGGNGNDEYNNYEHMAYADGGQKIHAYPITEWSLFDALKDINSQSRIATNILVGFHETCSAAGKVMGHVLLIHGIIDGTIYYTENFQNYIGGKTYYAGQPIKCTIEDFNTYYARPTVFKIEGVIWFEDEALTAAAGKGETYIPDKTGGESNTPSGGQSGGITKTFKTGIYQQTCAMNIRKSYSTSTASLGVIPNKSTVYVTEVHQDWGKVVTFLNGVTLDGWMYLDYSDWIGDLPPVAAEKYSGNLIVSQQWYGSLDAALSDSFAGKTLRLYDDCELDKTVTLGPGATVELGSHKLEMKNGAQLYVRGGRLIADTNVPAADVDPFLTVKTESGKKVYTCNISAEIKNGSLVIRNGAAAKIYADMNVPSTLTNATYELVCDDFAGREAAFKASYSSVSGGKLEFVTDSIPVEYMSDKMDFFVRITAVSNSVTYVYESDPVSFSASAYAGQIYGSNPEYNSLVASLLNYSTAKQKYDGWDPEIYSNLVLPASVRNVSQNDSLLVGAANAPSITSETNSHITSMHLALNGDVSMVFSMKDSSKGCKLLVFSSADYKRLTAGGKSASKVLTAANATATLTPDADGKFVFNGFSTKEYSDTFYFRLVDASGNMDSAFTFSVTEYCRLAVLTQPDDDVKNLCRSICEFCDAAKKCFP